MSNGSVIKKKIPISLEYYGLSHSLAVSQNSIAPEFFLYWYVTAGIGYILYNIGTIAMKYCLGIGKLKFLNFTDADKKYFVISSVIFSMKS